MDPLEPPHVVGVPDSLGGGLQPTEVGISDGWRERLVRLVFDMQRAELRGDNTP